MTSEQQAAQHGLATSEQTQLKFAVSQKTGELIGFVSRHSKTKQLRGVREDSPYRKKICVLSEDLKGTILPDVLYVVELKAMRTGKGFVVVKATPKVFEVDFIRKGDYAVVMQFGLKCICFDPVNGKTYNSRTEKGVIAQLMRRTDIKDPGTVVERFRIEAEDIRRKMAEAGIGAQEAFRP